MAMKVDRPLASHPQKESMAIIAEDALTMSMAIRVNKLHSVIGAAAVWEYSRV